ncbi:MAG: YtxH domain-containing protein [Desulfotignum sp.]|nr:YtxH domain-containing protein [Desulfotignum sp.]
MILNSLAGQAKQIRIARTRTLRQNRTKNMAIGAGIGTVIGVAAGILFAPKSGRETRQIITDRTSETLKDLKDNIASAKSKISASAKEKADRFRDKGQEAAEDVKENVKDKAKKA